MQATLQLRSGLKFDVRQRGRHQAIVLEDPLRGRFFQLGHREYQFLIRIDGQRTIDDIDSELQAASVHVDPNFLKTVCNWLAHNQLLVQSGSRFVTRLAELVQARNNQKSIARLNPICVKLRLFNPDRVLRQLAPWLQWIFRGPIVIAWLILIGAAVYGVSQHGDAFRAAAQGVLSPHRWLWLLVTWIALKLVHELAHGVCCRKYGVEVREAGVLFLLFAPLAYVDVTSAWRLASRWQRICISFAGMYVELGIAAAAALLWIQLPPGLVSDLCYNVVLTGGISSILFNANPLMRFDGYYILSDMLGISNLYNRGRESVWQKLDQLCLGIPSRPSPGNRRENSIIFIYGVGAGIWRILLTVSLLLVASTLADGIGLLLAALAAISWIVMPLKSRLQSIRARYRAGNVSPLRAAVSLTGLALIATAAILIVQAPAYVAAPVIVKHRQESIVRVGVSGFLTRVCVADGDTVEPGTQLAEIDNPELRNNLDNRIRERELAAIQSRIYLDTGQLAQYQAESKKLATLEQQIQELREQVEQLQVRAPIAGQVQFRGLQNRLQSYFKRGDRLLRIAQPQAKQLELLVLEPHIEALHDQSELPITVRIPGKKEFFAHWHQIQPRATTILKHPALGSQAGGALPVRPVANTTEENHYQLIQPRFTVTAYIPDAEAHRLLAGQTGTAYLPGRNMTLGCFLLDSARQWIKANLNAR